MVFTLQLERLFFLTLHLFSLSFLLLDENRRTIADKGGILLVVKALKTHAKHPGVQECGCRALQNMAGNGGKTNKKRGEEMPLPDCSRFQMNFVKRLLLLEELTCLFKQ
jgi:hypothetical protein